MQHQHIALRAMLQHILNPVHLWCLMGGGCKAEKLCRLFEKYIWLPVLRKLLDDCKEKHWRH